MQLRSEFGILALSWISPKRLERIIFLISSHSHHNVYKKCLKLSLTLIHCNTLKFQDKPILRIGQKSALQHSLFERYANFSKLMGQYIPPWLVHFSLNFIFGKITITSQGKKHLKGDWKISVWPLKNCIETPLVNFTLPIVRCGRMAHWYEASLEDVRGLGTNPDGTTCNFFVSVFLFHLSFTLWLFSSIQIADPF